ncbi:MAG: thioredoxin family protein [Alphaproteobacteria bacterium]|nr:thioredoxin family protein [Alphaproteobacteria bacterium]MBU0797302.1 thioredoxin family protein [Alphaproteobacteria bacterium]MBU0888910.1 thioredoxin family protein [Alphaproteobacteria bacterium]MBU1813930.1 thioredoxin family protein [Alphaproteobacteria bacterium]MBU2091365.1 thioredoxin family protein [Alphaproteobacteria bacterium]
MIGLRGVAALLVVLIGTAGMARAQTGPVSTDHVTAELVAGAQSAVPGQTIRIGLHKQIIPHWHTYWENPGDSGLPTTIEWKLPEGTTAGEILWPAPERIAVGPIMNYGYEGEVTLLTDIAIPATAAVGGSFPIRATVDWLVCEEICIPEQVTLGLDLPIIAAGSDPGLAHPAIAAAEARLPVDSSWPASFQARDGAIVLAVEVAGLRAESIEDIWFYADQWGVQNHAAPQALSVEPGRIVMSVRADDALPADLAALTGVLVVKERTGDGVLTQAFTIAAPAGAVAAGGGVAGFDSIGFGTALLFALLGGLILNLMPCVFPVLSMKALSLVSHARSEPAVVRLHGFAYTAGVLASFAALAALLVALKAAGQQIGWGFQFQSPVFVLLVAYLLFAVGLSLSGVFTIGASVAGVGSGLAARSGYAGSFFTGVLATIVATPCTAPFMGAAMGFALAAPTPVLFAVFLVLGLGLALPYILLSLFPPLLRFLPRPGPWMERFKQFLAFPMYGAAVWLVWVLSLQAGADGVLIALAGMLLIAFAAWLYDTTRRSGRVGRLTGTGLATLAALAAIIGGYVAADRAQLMSAQASAVESGAEAVTPWEAYTPEKLAALRAESRPVFVNFTAAWCITCLVNERVALNRPAIAEAFQSGDITYLKGDWTNQDKAITEKLAEFGRSGVPLYLFYPAGKNARPVVLPQILTVDGILKDIGAG